MKKNFTPKTILQDSKNKADLLIEKSRADLEISPSKEKVNSFLVALDKADISSDEKNRIIDDIKYTYHKLFNFNNCPEDYETLKKEAKFLLGITQHSFLLMAQRLLKIRDEKLYKADKYNTFREFIKNELPVEKSTVYNYLNLIIFFGVKPFDTNPELNPSKLIPVLPLLKESNDQITVKDKQNLKNRFIKEASKKSAREIKVKADEFKVKYGLKHKMTDYQKHEKSFRQLFNGFENKSLDEKEKDMLRDYIDQLNELL